MRFLLLLDRVLLELLIERVEKDFRRRVKSFSQGKSVRVETQYKQARPTLGNRRRSDMSKSNKHEIADSSDLIRVVDTPEHAVEILVTIDLGKTRVEQRVHALVRSLVSFFQYRLLGNTVNE
jgi:hypothetical protein